MATRIVNIGPGHMFIDSVSQTPVSTIQMGDTVIWHNLDADEHTVVSFNNPPFATLNPPLAGDLQPGDTYQYQFKLSGTFGYYCDIHGGDPSQQTGMWGIVNANVMSSGGAKPMSMAKSASSSGSSGPSSEGGLVRPAAATSQNWYAWNDLIPPGPPSFHIVGDVQVPNPGVDVFLVEIYPQGLSSQTIDLELIYAQRPGIWPQHVVVKHVTFEKYRAVFTNAKVYFGTNVIADLPVVNIV